MHQADISSRHSQRPNIVLVCVDQMRGDAMSGAGHPVVQTPYLDALAASGTTFPHAPTTLPRVLGEAGYQTQAIGNMHV